MSYTTQKTVTATAVTDGAEVRAGLVDPTPQAYPECELPPPAGRRDQLTARYQPELARVVAPNTDDHVNPGFYIELWSE